MIMKIKTLEDWIVFNFYDDESTLEENIDFFENDFGEEFYAYYSTQMEIYGKFEKTIHEYAMEYFDSFETIDKSVFVSKPSMVSFIVCAAMYIATQNVIDILSNKDFDRLNIM